MANRLFCFGLGYSATILASRLKHQGWRVAGTCRTADKQAALRGQGIDAYLFDRDRPLADPQQILAGATHILSSVPPDGQGDPVLDHHGDAIAVVDGVVWIGYLSTTGVYGDRGGAFVDETVPVAPITERARRRAEAESRWLALQRDRGRPVHVFRLPGIYGPGRSAIEAVRDGSAKRIRAPGQFFARIHVEDIATVLEASIRRPNPGAIYNVVDDEPAPQAEVVAHAAGLLGVPPPPLQDLDAAGLSPMARSFYAENRRVRNDRIKRELGVTLRYPTYREGLAAAAARRSRQPT